MTFTYDLSLSTDLAKVRFHTADTNTDGHYVEDETITALLTIEGSVGGAVIAVIKYIIGQLSSPDFRADWLQISNKAAREGYEKRLLMKQSEFSIGGLVVGTLNLGIDEPCPDEDPDCR